jgi:uncharacterized glyoxalase superfamily protein PhnB
VSQDTVPPRDEQGEAVLTRDEERRRELERYFAETESGLSEAERRHGHSLKHLPSGRRVFFGVVPVFLVDDVVAACEYYQGVLGFDIDFTYGEPASFACVSRNNAMINFNLARPRGARNSAAAAGAQGLADAYVLVTQIEEVYDELRQSGARVLGAPASRDYGMREFEVEDCNGYRLTLAEGVIGG